MNAELNSSSGASLILVTPGSFIMGSPQSEPGHMVWEGQREVTLSHEFYLGATPVTQRQYELATGENPTVHPGAGKDAPVDSVSWDMANAFCGKLTEMDRQAGVLRDGWEYRLPTEAEWEYACRAGNQEARYGDADSIALDSIAWYLDNAEGRPHTVGQKVPNDWGFHANGVRTGFGARIPVARCEVAVITTRPPRAAPLDAKAGCRAIAGGIAECVCLPLRWALSS